MNHRMIKPGRLMAIGCLVLAGAVACRSGEAVNQLPAPNTNRPQAASVKPSEMADVTRPKTVEVKPAVPRFTGNGRLSFVEHRKLTFRTGGNVGQINVKETDRVSKGQALAKLDTTSLGQAVKAAELAVKTAEMAIKTAEMDRAQAEFNLQSAEADLKQVQNNVKSAGIDLDQATDNFRKITYPYTYSTFVFDVPQAIIFINEANRQINTAQSGLQIGLPAERYYEAVRQLTQALDNLAKGRELLTHGQGQDVFQSGVLNVRDFWTLRTAQLAMDKAQVALESVQNAASKTALTIDGVRNSLNKAQVAVDKANNDKEIASNNLGIARINFENATITAPFDGVIARVNVKEGDFLSSGSFATTIAIEIIDPGRMELNILVNEIDIPGLKVGQNATISVDALPGKRLESTVTSINLLPETASSVISYQVKIAFAVSEDLLCRSLNTSHKSRFCCVVGAKKRSI